MGEGGYVEEGRRRRGGFRRGYKSESDVDDKGSEKEGGKFIAYLKGVFADRGDDHYFAGDGLVAVHDILSS